MTTVPRLTALVLCAVSIGAVQTKTWSLRDQSDLEKAALKGVALRSDGRMTLAPAVKELFDAGTPYLWAIAQDSKGIVYAAGGGQGSSTVRIHRVDAAGKGSTFAEVEGLEIHALAVDKQDQVYAATSPEGKIWRIGADRKPSLFYDSKAKYIWAIVFGAGGELYVATGDPGEVHRVNAAGKGSVLYHLEDAHARSMALDEKGNVILGTEPSGLIVRVTPAGEGFILHQSSKREVTAVVASGGRIYAAVAGSKTAPPPAPAIPPPPAPASSNPAMVINPMAPRPTAPVVPPTGVAGATVSGGSELVEIAADGAPRTVWSHPQDIVYALVLNETGQPALGTGNKGAVYRVETPTLSSLLLSATSTQITALLAGRSNTLFAATANVGKILQIGPGFETRGTVESDVFDAGLFSYWGRLHGDLTPNGGTVAFETRSGNLDRPQKSWSNWTPLKDGRIASPPARFLQWRATLTAPATGGSSTPELFGAEAAWLAKNVSPRVEEVEATPANYRFPQPSSAITPPNTLMLPPLGRRQRSGPGPASDAPSPSPTLNYAKGSAGVRWLASDTNGDRLECKVEIKGVNETTWKLLRDHVRERYLTYDSTAFPDGDYVIRVAASDAPDNAPADALTAELISAPFLIDNTAPKIESLSAQPAGGRVQTLFRATDDSSWIAKAEYSVNGVEWMVVEPVSKLSDSKALDYNLLLDRPQPGELTIAVRVTDEFDNQAVSKVVVK